MANTSLYIVTDDAEQAQRIKNVGIGMGCTVQVYSTQEWANKNGSTSNTSDMLPSLSAGTQPLQEGGKVLQFRQPTAPMGENEKVKTINELESIAIENAISEFGGNLTEAAKALGIGRATLYRKVKQYGIDPSMARRKKAQVKAA